MSSSHINRARRPIHLKQEDGTEKVFHMRPLTDRDISELDEWVRSQYLQTVRRSLDGESIETRELETRVAQQVAMSLTWMSGAGAKMIATVDGMAKLVHQSCEEDISFEDLRALMFNADNVNESRRVFREANSPGESNSGKDQGRRQSRKRNRRRPHKR